MKDTYLYQTATPLRLRAFIRSARKAERMMVREGGSPIDPLYATRKIQEIFRSAQPITVPPGGNTYIVRASYDMRDDWGKVARAGGPDTPRHHDVLDCERDRYAERSEGVIEEHLILARFGFVPFRRTEEWADRNRLCPANPRAVCAVARDNPDLDKTLGAQDLMFICTFPSETETSFYVKWEDGAREVGFDVESEAVRVAPSRQWRAFSRI